MTKDIIEALTDDEIAVCTKALDIHRQALMNKLRNRLNPENTREIERTQFDIVLCGSASSKLKQVEDERISA